MARPVEFVYEDVLTNAMEQFWSEGFEASSVQKLLDATGINRGTLYNSFGDKDTFFRSCLKHYSELVQKDLDASLNSEELAPWDAVRQYFRLAVLAASAKRRSKGCLLVNSFCESINWDKDLQKAVKGYYSTIRKAFLKRMKDAKKAGQLGKDVTPELAADVLMNTLNGVRVSSREGKAPKQMQAVVDVTVRSLQ
ncbi:MAG: TetR/AcrR family transcriptional regulator [Pseudohongiellaceae bacterium]